MIAKREALRCIDSVKRVVEEEIRTNGSGMFGRGLSNEGFASGYYHLVDVEAAPMHGYSSHRRGYPLEAEAERITQWRERKA
jgi:hypothetical protein